MNISNQELCADGFQRAGTVFPDPLKILRVQIDSDLRGFVVYLMVVNHDVKKAGIAGRGKSTFKARMISEFQTVRQVIAGPSPNRAPARWRARPLDPFKEHAHRAIRVGCEVELWAREYPSIESMFAKEAELNEKYQPEWTKEGKRTRLRGAASSLRR
jgi:hypothetical protein